MPILITTEVETESPIDRACHELEVAVSDITSTIYNASVISNAERAQWLATLEDARHKLDAAETWLTYYRDQKE